MAVEEGWWDRTSDNSQEAGHRSENRVGLEGPRPNLRDFGKSFSKKEDL